MLTVEEAIRSRRATRKYTDLVPSDEVIDRVAELALEAPSAFNAQLRDLVVVRDHDVKEALFEASAQRQFLDAPVVVVAVGRSGIEQDDDEEILGAERAKNLRAGRATRSEAVRREHGLRDAMLVGGFLLVAAQAEGLATSPTTGWDEEKVKEAIGIGGRSDRSIALVVAAGYPDETPAHPGRAANRRVDDRY